MIEIKGNMWDYHDKGIPVCVLTNATMTKKGEIVMGKGCALEAKQRFPNLPKELADRLTANGKLSKINVLMWFKEYNLFTFPTVHNWFDKKADLKLIGKSARDLDGMMDLLGLEKVVLPRPGCGLGNLTWEEVKPVLENWLDDRVLVISP